MSLGNVPELDVTRRSFMAGLGLAASAIAVGGGVAACSGGSDTGKSETALKFWSRESYNNGTLQPVLQARVAEFDKANGSKTEVLFLNFVDSTQKTQAALAAGKPPNVGEQGPDVALQFAAGKSLANLDDLVTMVQPKMVDLQKDAYVRVDGKNYAQPWYTETRVLMYHKDLAERAGAQPPTDWAEWIDFTAKLKASGVDGFVIPGQGAGPGQLFVPLAAAAGGVLLEEDGSVTKNVDPFVAALDHLLKLFKAGMPTGTPTYKDADADQLFQLKKTGSIWANGSVLQSAAKTPGLTDNIDAVLTPPADHGGVTRSFLGGFGLFVFEKSGDQDKSKALIEYLLEPEWYAKYLEKSGGFALPVIAETAKQAMFSQGVIGKLVEQQKTAVRYGGTKFGNAPFLGRAETQLVFANPVTDVWNGKMRPAEAASSMLENVRKLSKS